jgi:TPR repeat protein
LMYANGTGLEKNYIQAYKWLDIAAAAGNDSARITRNELKKRMTASQIKIAENIKK